MGGGAKERGGMIQREEKEEGYDRERTSEGISGEKSILLRLHEENLWIESMLQVF